MAKIKIKESYLFLINTHLQSSYLGVTQEDWVNIKKDKIIKFILI